MLRRWFSSAIMAASLASPLAGLLLPSSQLSAQSFPSPDNTNSALSRPRATVEGAGDKTVKLTAERIRLLMIIKAQGRTAKEALVALEQHKQSVRDELRAMKADTASVKINHLELAHSLMGMPEAFRDYRPARLAKMLEDTVNVRAEDFPIVFTASAYVQADWIVAGNEPDVVLQLPTVLREQAIQRDLFGEGNTLEISPEQTNLLEKIKAELSQTFGFDDDEENDEPIAILFVANVLPQHRAAAFKSAFEAAQAECELLAVAANAKLGSLFRLTSRMTPNYDYVSDDSFGLIARHERTRHNREIVAREPDSLSAEFEVQATFALENAR